MFHAFYIYVFSVFGDAEQPLAYRTLVHILAPAIFFRDIT